MVRNPLVNYPNYFLNAKYGEAYIIDNGQRISLFHAKSINTKVTKTKTSVHLMGESVEIPVVTSWAGTGELQLFFCTDYFRQHLYDYCSGVAPNKTYELFVRNYDVSAANIDNLGSHDVVYRGVDFDEMVLSNIDTEGTIIEETVPFTFTNWELTSTFKQYDELTKDINIIKM